MISNILTFYKYRKILDYAVKEGFVLKPLEIKKLEHYSENVLTIEHSAIDLDSLIGKIEEEVSDACAKKKYLPIVRLGDGEFRLLVGPQLDYYSVNKIPTFLRSLARAISFRLSPTKIYSATSYSGQNKTNWWRHVSFKRLAVDNLRSVIEQGYIAPHCSLTNNSFQAQYLEPILKLMLREYGRDGRPYLISFYSVYAICSRGVIFRGRNVNVICADKTAEQRQNLSKIFKEKYGASGVSFTNVPLMDTENYKFETAPSSNVDIYLFGLGIYKLHLLPQFSSLERPIIDAGYMIERWCDPQSQERPFCVI